MVIPRKTLRHASKDAWRFLYKENHALDAWFCIAYGDEQKEN